VSRHPVLPAPGRDVIFSLLRDRDGRIWAGHEGGLVVFVPDPAAADASPPWRELKRGPASAEVGGVALPAAPGEARLFGDGDGLKRGRIRRLLQTADGHVWAGTLAGLSEFDGRTFRNYTEAEGLRGGGVSSAAVARDGSLWLGTNGAGLVRLTKGGFTVFRAADGLGHPLSLSLFEDPDGNFYTADLTGHVNLFDHATSRFVSARLNLPDVVYSTGWNPTRRIIRARDGEWWAATAHGLFRFPRVERIEQLAAARPSAHYTTRDGMAYNDAALLFEDSRGDLWFSTFAAQRVAVTRWERATETFHNYSDSDGTRGADSRR
jgi:ligand-binding sensor domain-containing protein